MGGFDISTTDEYFIVIDLGILRPASNPFKFTTEPLNSASSSPTNSATLVSTPTSTSNALTPNQSSITDAPVAASTSDNNPGLSKVAIAAIATGPVVVITWTIVGLLFWYGRKAGKLPRDAAAEPASPPSYDEKQEEQAEASLATLHGGNPRSGQSISDTLESRFAKSTSKRQSLGEMPEMLRTQANLIGQPNHVVSATENGLQKNGK